MASHKYLGKPFVEYVYTEPYHEHLLVEGPYFPLCMNRLNFGISNVKLGSND